MESRTNRYQSRILREMHQNKENPFNSPPSSTGSHGTVTLTSDLSYGPEGESTRRYEDSIILPGLSNKPSTRGAQATPFKVNTSAIGRNFPEWNDRDQTEDLYNVTGDYTHQAKENIPPSSSTVASPSQIDARKSQPGTFGTRAHMQARVDDESDHSGDIRPALSARQHNSSAAKKGNSWQPQRGNVTSLIQTLKAAQAAKESTPKKSSPKRDERRSSINRQSRIVHTHLSPATPNQTARSFFLPNLEYINDFVSGVLRLSSVRNGIPVFVKHGKVHDRESDKSPEDHIEVEAIDIPQDEQEIFVSLDKIREEIHTLQAHDDQVSRQAEQLQEEIYELQTHLSKLRSRKDSAMGSDSESSMVDYLNGQKTQLEDKVATLQAKLDKANRKISINEIHTESYVNERDEALKSATSHLEKISSLQAELDATRNELHASRGGTLGKGLSDDEIRSLREDSISLRSQYKVLLEENHSQRSHNTLLTQQNTEFQQEIKRLQRLVDSTQDDRDLLQRELEGVAEEKRTLREDNLSLERHNDQFYNDNKSLQQKVSLLERRVHDLQDNNAQLHQMLDGANAETGTMTLDMKDIKDRLGKKNGTLSDENMRLQEQIIELNESYTSKRLAFEHEKQRLLAENDRLHNRLDTMSKQFEQILQDSRKEFEQERESFTRQIDEIAGREAALATRIRDNAEKDTTLQKHIQRRNEVVEEARRITKEIDDLQANAAKSKPVKVTRIVEPTTSRSRSTLSEISAKSTTGQLDTQMRDDFTQQIDLTQGSDLDLLPKGEMDKLREALRRARSDSKEQDFTDDHVDDEAGAGHTEDMSQVLPPAFIPEAQRVAASRSDLLAGKRQPSGILKNTQATQRLPEQDLTGRFSVKSAMSGMSMPSHTGRSDISLNRRHSDSARFDLDVEENMTSALFMDDITLDARKRAAEKEATKTKSHIKKPVRTLSAEAKRVLDSLCADHVCRNCIVCTRINSHKHEDVTEGDKTKRQSVVIKQPVPVTDRIANPTADSEADVTMRPAQEPGLALATVIKNLEDEAAHLKAAIAKKQALYNSIDPSFGRRQRKQVNAELNRLMKMLDMKNDQIYKLFDVVEGQKKAGQHMSEAEVQITITSIMAADDTWDGILD